MSNDSFDFKSLWQQQKTAAPDMGALLLRVKAFKRKNLRRLLLANLALLGTTVAIIAIWYYAQPRLISTKIGMVLVIVAMLIFLLAYNRQLGLVQGADPQLSGKDYLNSLLRLREKQKFMQTTMLSIYFVLLSLGIGLYMYEYAAQMSGMGAVAAYGLAGAWILLNWFYIRPKTIQKQQAKLNALIAELEAVQGQFTAQ
jgi:uncharacterized membrane protein